MEIKNTDTKFSEGIRWQDLLLYTYLLWTRTKNNVNNITDLKNRYRILM